MTALKFVYLVRSFAIGIIVGSEKLELLLCSPSKSRCRDLGPTKYFKKITFKTNVVMKLALQYLTIFHYWNTSGLGHRLNGHQKHLKSARPACLWTLSQRKRSMPSVRMGISTCVRRGFPTAPNLNILA